MISGIIICHNQLAFEYVYAVNKIFGQSERLYPFSNTNLAPKALFEKINGFIRENHLREAVLMVDLRGGSCWTTAKLIMREYPHFKTLSGVNIPMLLSFMTKREQYPVPELIKVIENDGHRGILID